MRRIVVLLGIFILGAILFACAPKAMPATLVEVAAPVTKSDWETEWEKVLKEAKKEGRVVIYGSPKPEAYKAISEGFKKAFGLEIETVTGRSAEIVNKVRIETRTGLYLPDIFTMGGVGNAVELAALGVQAKLDPLIVLPEVKDDKSWYKGSMENHFIDPKHFTFAFIAALDIPLARNINLVEPGEIKAWEDLLQPKWKGKITVNDPTISGKGQSNFAMIGKIKGWDFWRSLSKQEPLVIRDTRLQTDWLAKGKYAILVSPSTSAAQTFIDAGAPIAFIRLKEGNYTSSSGGVVSVMDKAPHPNATIVFLNWLLTREGQTLWSRADGVQSARLDVSTEGLDPLRVREPGVIYPASDDWEFYMWREKNNVENIAREIFGPFMIK